MSITVLTALTQKKITTLKKRYFFKFNAILSRNKKNSSCLKKIVLFSTVKRESWKSLCLKYLHPNIEENSSKLYS